MPTRSTSGGICHDEGWIRLSPPASFAPKQRTPQAPEGPEGPEGSMIGRRHSPCVATESLITACACLEKPKQTSELVHTKTRPSWRVHGARNPRAPFPSPHRRVPSASSSLSRVLVCCLHRQGRATYRCETSHPTSPSNCDPAICHPSLLWLRCA